jgi:hypothetical protein
MPIECSDRLFGMRGDDQQLQTGMFSYVALEDRIPQDHPLRALQRLVGQVPAGMSKQFDGLYSAVGRPSIPPERLFRALLLQVYHFVANGCSWSNWITVRYSVGSWGLEIDDTVWDATSTRIRRVPIPGRNHHRANPIHPTKPGQCSQTNFFRQRLETRK